MTQFELHQGDCLEVMKTLPDNSVDSIVTDPPYGISFMGKKWDYDVPGVDVWAEALRLLKPGGHALVACGTRTQHRMAVNLEDAGFEIRDIVAWIYGSGFPKSLDVSKAIDKMHGVEREVIGQKIRGDVQQAKVNGSGYLADPANRNNEKQFGYGVENLTTPATDEAKQWNGWGTALKPAMELWTLARKPLEGTVAANVLKHGTGGLHIDGCRVPTNEIITNHSRGSESAVSKGKYGDSTAQDTHQTNGQALGRFPANLIHDGSDEVVGLFPESKSAGNYKNTETAKEGGNGMFAGGEVQNFYANETGSAARFFYCAKASKSDRNGGLDGFPVDRPDSRTAIGMGTFEEKGVQPQQNHHPTVKPTALMQYLCRLITPPGGTVLDPYTGSGSTGKAAMFEDFRFIGIERELEYVEIATARIEAARTREPLFLEADSQKTQGRLF